jgi:RNA polymerase sigma-70 factor, ECF subfamily
VTLMMGSTSGPAPREPAHALARPSMPRSEGHVCPLGATDRGLVEAIQAGNSHAAAPLYDSLRPSIDQALHRVLRGRPPEFEDLMQVTFERVIRTIAEGNFEGRSQLKTWASAIAAHVAVDWLRRRTQEQRLFEAIDLDAVEPQAFNVLLERQLEARSEVRRIHGILGRMKPRRATILVLHDVLGYSAPQVAQFLGINVSTAQSRLRRARQEFLRRWTTSLSRRSAAAGESRD